jgi:hypothetical protein
MGQKAVKFRNINLDGDWPIRRQNPYQHQFVNVNNNNYTCCAKTAGKEVTPTCRKKTVTWTNEMIEDLIDFIEIHPIVASRKLGSRKLEFKFVYTRCKKF